MACSRSVSRRFRLGISPAGFFNLAETITSTKNATAINTAARANVFISFLPFTKETDSNDPDYGLKSRGASA
jgi:hypothetical protein